MRETSKHKTAAHQRVSRRDFLKFCSLLIGGVSLPRALVSTLEQSPGTPRRSPLPKQDSFQWQNQYLCKTIYPMREEKLRDFLLYTMEVDVWSKYKDKNIASMSGEVFAYQRDWETNAAVALEEYTFLRNYFLKEDVRADYSGFQPIDTAELDEINNLHAIFAQSWPKDIRGERSILDSIISRWEQHSQGIRNWLKWQKARHEAMDPAHPKYIPEGEQLNLKENTTLPMAEQEMVRLRAFLATYDRIEERKLDWYQRTKRDPNFKTPEAEYLTRFPPERQVTLRDIARWRVEEHKKHLSRKNQYELLDLINQRFQKEPQRFPPWLQYMVVHFSGMRYASAHGSWADPRDLLARLHAPLIEAEAQGLDDAEVENLCAEKIAAYGATGAAPKPALALAEEKEWRDQIGWYLPQCKSNNPRDRRQGLIALRKVEDAYALMRKSSEEALELLRALKNDLPVWAWNEIVRLTPLRVSEADSYDWEKPTPQQEEERASQENYPLRAILDAWQYTDPTAWREEHSRTLDLIVTRAVCNEVAEHCQHLRGRQPPGGLMPKPGWYAAMESDGSAPGAYFVRPTSEKDYTPGASIFWLRFVDYQPAAWQIAKWIVTRQKVGLLPDGNKNKKKIDKNQAWVYKINANITTRTRTIITPEKKKVVERQWLRWIHEATVMEVAETADGMMVFTFETALPDGKTSGTSTAGALKMPLKWHISDGAEDQFNRSFVGYAPPGELPAARLKEMLDWNKIFQV